MNFAPAPGDEEIQECELRRTDNRLPVFVPVLITAESDYVVIGKVHRQLIAVMAELSKSFLQKIFFFFLRYRRCEPSEKSFFLLFFSQQYRNVKLGCHHRVTIGEPVVVAGEFVRKPIVAVRRIQPVLERSSDPVNLNTQAVVFQTGEETVDDGRGLFDFFVALGLKSNALNVKTSQKRSVPEHYCIVLHQRGIRNVIAQGVFVFSLTLFFFKHNDFE